MLHPPTSYQSLLVTASAITLAAALLVPVYAQTEIVPENAKTEAPEVRWYQVELIIAERTVDEVITEDLHKPDLLILGGENYLTDFTGNQAQEFVRLPEEQRLLNQAAARLERSSKYQLLFHQAWPQAFIKHGPTRWVDVSSDDLVFDQPKLAGAVGIQLKRYLHVSTQLALHHLVVPKTAATDPIALLVEAEEASQPWLNNSTLDTAPLPSDNLVLSEPPPTLHIYAMNQSRKMRSRRLHYLDHPKLALIVRIDPYDPQTGRIPEQE